MSALHTSPLADDHYRQLADSVATLENPSLAARIADYAGAPVNRVIAMLPTRIDRGLNKVVEATMLRCLTTAIRTLDDKETKRPATLLSSMAVGVTGGLSGFVGLAALPVELPVTTTLMLRSIADIARANGEDLSKVEARLACLQVFGLGGGRAGARRDVGYFAARTLMTRMTAGAAAHLIERSAAELTAPAMNRLIAELVSRFSVVLSDRIAASSLPVIGAIGGATVNVIFMNHFQQVAKGHFTVRRLERRYGQERVREQYLRIAQQQAAGR